ncbi:hypothetical protein PR001_g7309 [Phytophthora rubi]|uniref:Uncharacterized protein n=1 Tax=Phytophthora rubi TaxID=129364 RepID=A0A6A3N932_9STRA|nr:hypothetical protein PR001_g7309 [Phytophthora rubi]
MFCICVISGFLRPGLLWQPGPPPTGSHAGRDCLLLGGDFAMKRCKPPAASGFYISDLTPCIKSHVAFAKSDRFNIIPYTFLYANIQRPHLCRGHCVDNHLYKLDCG